MPWKTKRLLWLMTCGFALIVLAIVIFVRDDSTDSVLLACMGVIGGIAVIITNLPNGNGT
jgi:hypothetical protein